MQPRPALDTRSDGNWDTLHTHHQLEEQVMTDVPPNVPLVGQVSEVRYAEEQDRLRRKEAEDRQKALIAEARRKASESSKDG